MTLTIKSLLSYYQMINFHIASVEIHRGRHTKIFGWAKSAAYDRRYTAMGSGGALGL